MSRKSPVRFTVGPQAKCAADTGDKRTGAWVCPLKGRRTDNMKEKTLPCAWEAAGDSPFRVPLTPSAG